MEEDKKIFLEKARALFYLNGAKNTTMDEIANAFSISKKTLYQRYENKEELLKDVLRYELELVIEAIHRFDEVEDCPIHKMLRREDKINEMAEGNNTLFTRQLKKYYTHLYESHIRKLEVEITHILQANVKSGRALGLYRSDFDVVEYARFLMLIIFAYDDSPLIDDSSIFRKDFNQNAILMYLNAICTEKGKNVLYGYLHQ